MLFVCAHARVQAMKQLLRDGAVPDTWAPNGSSALMLAAAANSPEALCVLLQVRTALHPCACMQRPPRRASPRSRSRVLVCAAQALRAEWGGGQGQVQVLAAVLRHVPKQPAAGVLQPIGRQRAWLAGCVWLQAGASLELQDALGRSALMFAAGNCAQEALVTLLDAGGAAWGHMTRPDEHITSASQPGVGRVQRMRVPHGLAFEARGFDNAEQNTRPVLAYSSHT